MHVFSDQKSVKCFKCGLIQPVSFRDEVSCRRRRIKRSRSWTEGDLHSDFKASGSKRQRGNRLPTILEDSAGSAGEDEKLSEGYSDPDDPRLCEAKQLETEDKEIDLLKIFECPVCRELLLNPVTLKCGHSLCEECMIQYLENGTGRCKCPAGCQTVIPFYLPPVNVTLRQALNNKLPVRSNLRKSDESKSVSYRREKLADASAICSIIPNGTEGRPLEIVRREIRIMRMQNQQLLNREQIRRALAEGTPRPERHGPEPIFSLPVSALWLLGMMICTTWSLTQKRGIEMLRLDWGKVKQGQVWRLATTFLTLGDRYNMWKSGFSLIRIYFLKSYEPSIGTVKYAQNLLIKAVILLAHDYMLIHGNALQDEKVIVSGIRLLHTVLNKDYRNRRMRMTFCRINWFGICSYIIALRNRCYFCHCCSWLKWNGLSAKNRKRQLNL